MPATRRNMAGPLRQEPVRFRLSASVELVLGRGDITRWCVDGQTDAIVNAANERMLGGAGVDGAIHFKAGPKLLDACREMPEVSPGVRCPTGEAKVTEGYNLRVSRIIHTVGPRFGQHNAQTLLSNAYKNSLKAAIETGIKYIAFPAISCGVFRYPIEDAAGVSLSAIKEAAEGLTQIHFVHFEPKTYIAWLKEAEKQFTRI